MAQDGRDNTIWVKEGPGNISGAAEGPLTDLTFAAKDLYDVSGPCIAVICPQHAELTLSMHPTQAVLDRTSKCTS